MTPPQRVAIAAAAAYTALLVALAVGLDRGGSPFESVVLVAALACASFAAGLLVGRWWTLLLPLAGVALAALLGEPNAESETSAWLVLAFWSPFLLLFVGLGLLAAVAVRRARA